MTYRRSPVLALSALLAFYGCSSSNGPGGGDNGPGNTEQGTNDVGVTDLGDGTTDMGGGTTDMGAGDQGRTVLLDGGFVDLDGGGTCQVKLCQDAQGRISMNQCGNCIDDDADGLVDLDDPECLTFCDDHEATYSFFDPTTGGGDTPSCNLDCYYDSDVGFGNDRCRWNGSCDPLTPDPTCPRDDDLQGTNTCPLEQSPDCATRCGPLVPNGCDCFGCCELPAGGGDFVFIGTGASERAPTCTLEAAEAGNTTACAPCTPRLSDDGCYNDCGRCELCLGRTFEDLPCDCFPSGSAPATCTQVDIGVPDDMGPPTDAGTMDGGTVTPPWDCGGRQACDFPGLPECSNGGFCVTGCCVNLG